MEKSEKLKKLIDFLKTKKTNSLKVLDISNISILADYFVIVTVSTERNVEAIDSEICDEMEKNGYSYKSKEGIHTKWVLIDYSDIIIHIFDDEYKDFYNLDKLWADAKVIIDEN